MMYMRVAFLFVLVSLCLAELEKCKRDFKKVGCMKRNNALFTDQLANNRDTIVWKDYQSHLHSLACKCSTLAKKGNYTTFAIGFYGECFAAKASEKLTNWLNDDSSGSNTCVSGTFGTCDMNADEECTGKAGNEFVYLLSTKKPAHQAINGGYSEWSAWKECSVSCGIGVQERDRTCTYPLPANGGNDCQQLGNATELRLCKLKNCSIPVNCTYHSGDGIGGTEISIGKEASHIECAQECMLRKKTDDSINGATYSTTGSKKCYCEKRMTGRNNNKVWKSCMFMDSLIDGGYSAWSNWKECSVSCGAGAQERERTCKIKECQKVAKRVETRPCNQKNCSIPVNCTYHSGDGIGGTEKYIGKERSDIKCAQECMLRKKTDDSINGATYSTTGSKKCYCEKRMTERNNNKVWKSCMFMDSLIDGGYSAWSNWKECSVSCGAGAQERERTCKIKECQKVAKRVETRPCNQKNCSIPVNCTYHSGDGIGGTEKYIGKEKSDIECAQECMLRKKTDDSINGATYSTTGSKKCYCEKRMTGRNNNKVWKSCLFGS